MKNAKSLKEHKMQTNTSKNIALPEHEQFQNDQEKQFAETYVKQSTIDKFHAFQFENNTEKCRDLVNYLLKEYDLWHPETETTVCESVHESESDAKISVEIKENSCEDDHNINETESNNIKLKSNIIFLELENKKLQLKQRLLEKKYQKESLEVKMAPNMEISWRKKQKQLLEVELKLLKETKELSQKLQELRNPPNSCLILETKSYTYESNSGFYQKPSKQKKKKLNKLKLLKYLIQKTQTIHSSNEFLQLLDKTQASLSSL